VGVCVPLLHRKDVPPVPLEMVGDREELPVSRKVGEREFPAGQIGDIGELAVRDFRDFLLALVEGGAVLVRDGSPLAPSFVDGFV